MSHGVKGPGLAAVLAEAREEAKLSFRVAAKRSGVAVSQIQKYEAGASPKAETLERLAAAYKTTAAVLLSRAGDQVRAGGTRLLDDIQVGIRMGYVQAARDMLNKALDGIEPTALTLRERAASRALSDAKVAK